MEKRSWTDIKVKEPEILTMRAAGKTRQEIANELGLTKIQVKNWVSRYNREQARQEAGVPLRQRGRPRKKALTTEAGYQYEIQSAKARKRAAEGFSAARGKEVRIQVKYQVIHRHCERYSVSVMCQIFEVSRSGYYAFVKRLTHPDRDAPLAEMIRRRQKRCGTTYGYRRVRLWLKKQGVQRNPKTVLRVRKKYELLSEIRRPRRWRQMGEHIRKYESLLSRDFQTSKPNSKWGTDISSIHTGEGVLYLSMIRDLYDNSIVAYKTATAQTVSLVLDTIRAALNA